MVSARRLTAAAAAAPRELTATAARSPARPTSPSLCETSRRLAPAAPPTGFGCGRRRRQRQQWHRALWMRRRRRQQPRARPWQRARAGRDAGCAATAAAARPPLSMPFAARRRPRGCSACVGIQAAAAAQHGDAGRCLRVRLRQPQYGGCAAGRAGCWLGGAAAWRRQPGGGCGAVKRAADAAAAQQPAFTEFQYSMSFLLDPADE